MNYFLFKSWKIDEIYSRIALKMAIFRASREKSKSFLVFHFSATKVRSCINIHTFPPPEKS